MKRNRIQVGFTLLEMLSALAIIAVMIGLLIPAISKIQDTAHTVKQKAQFGAIEIALEAFNADTGDYPPSDYIGANQYCGAQELAEAIVGMDGFGFHPKSAYRSDRLDTSGTTALYYGRSSAPILESLPYDDPDPSIPDQKANLDLRKGPYVELEKANAVTVRSLYGNIPILNPDTFVLADTFSNVKNTATGKKSGMPILYYKADVSNFLHDWNNPTLSTYNVNNNPFIGLPVPWDTSIVSPMGLAPNGPKIFYDRIRNPNFPGTVANGYTDARPYRATSFILLSAGADGVYGSSDDVYNIDENEK